MAAIIHSENFLAVCLIFARGDVNKSFETVIKTAEEYQQLFNRHFGITQDDFRNCITMMFYWEMGMNSEDIMKEQDSSDELKPNILLKDGITHMLNKREAHFNDSGEEFLDCMIISSDESDEYKILREKSFVGIKNYFNDKSYSSPDDVITFLENYPDYIFTEHGDYYYGDNDEMKLEFSKLSNILQAMESDNGGLIDFLKTHPQCFYVLFRCSSRGEGS
ncbi:MAG: hypothetical protein V1720_18910 [bacterium]